MLLLVSYLYALCSATIKLVLIVSCARLLDSLGYCQEDVAFPTKQTDLHALEVWELPGMD